MKIFFAMTVVLLAGAPAIGQGNTWVQKNDIDYHLPNGPRTGNNGEVGLAINGVGYYYSGGSINNFWRYDIALDDWIACASMPGSGRSDATGFVVGGKGYIGTGSTGGTMLADLWQYDPVNDAWTQRASLPGVPRYRAAGFSIAEKGYIGFGSIGSTNGLTDLWEYYPQTDQWTQRASMPSPGRVAPMVFTIQGIAYVCGGNYAVEGNEFYPADSKAYDPATDSWSSIAGVGNRKMGAAFTLGSKGYIAGGMSYGTATAPVLLEYDPVANSWTPRPDVPGGPRGKPFSFVVSGKAYMGAGGNAGTQNVRLRDVWRYDPITVQWSEVRSLGGAPRERAAAFAVGDQAFFGLGCFGGTDLYNLWNYSTTDDTWSDKAVFAAGSALDVVCATVNGRGYTAAGVSFSNSMSSSTREYDPATDLWMVKAPFPQMPYHRDAAGFAIGGKFYLGTGRMPTTFTGLSAFWMFDPVANTWTQRAPFPGPLRWRAVGFSLGNKGFIATGATGSGFLSDLWEYDPTANSWTQRASMPVVGRDRAVAFVIGTKAYVAAGMDGNNGGTYLNDLWEYDPATDSWTQRASLPGVPRIEAAAFSSGASAWVLGGSSAAGVLPDVWKYTSIDPSSTVRLSPRVLLEGPHITGTGTMSDQLRTQGMVPIIEPYTASGYAHVLGGGETTTTTVLSASGNNAVVDWVVVELRHSANPAWVVASRSALVQKDGDVVAADGTSPLQLLAAPGNYHVAIRHRNHLGIMTNTALALSTSAVVVDLTSQTTTTYGTEARKPSGTHMLMRTGDATGEGTLKYTGAANDRDPILIAVGSTTPNNTVPNVYDRRDTNLDGVIKYTGSANDRDIILTNVGSTTPNNTRTQQLP